MNSLSLQQKRMNPFAFNGTVKKTAFRLVSVFFAIVCIGCLISCGGDVGSPEMHISGGEFNLIKPDFTATKTDDTQIPVEGRHKITIAAINGEVMVTGQRDVDLVMVTAHFTVGSDSQTDADTRIDDLEIQVTESAEEISLQTIHPQNTDGREYDVAYDIIVPSHFAVNAIQVNGSIDIIDIENRVDVANTNGDVMLSNITGGVVADVVNGSIAAIVTLPIHETIDLITDNGSIELRIPSSTGAVLGASVGIGTIHTSNLAFADLVQTSQSLTGTLNNGEGVIELWVGNGDISVLGLD